MPWKGQTKSPYEETPVSSCNISHQGFSQFSQFFYYFLTPSWKPLLSNQHHITHQITGQGFQGWVLSQANKKQKTLLPSCCCLSSGENQALQGAGWVVTPWDGYIRSAPPSSISLQAPWTGRWMSSLGAPAQPSLSPLSGDHLFSISSEILQSAVVICGLSCCWLYFSPKCNACHWSSQRRATLLWRGKGEVPTSLLWRR